MRKPCASEVTGLLGGESGIRTRGGLASSPVFKTGAFSQLDHLSLWGFELCQFTNESPECQWNGQGAGQGLEWVEDSRHGDAIRSFHIVHTFV